MFFSPQTWSPFPLCGGRDGTINLINAIAPGFKGLIKVLAVLILRGNLADTLGTNDEAAVSNGTCKLSLPDISR